MKKLKYIITRIGKDTFKKMLDIVEKVHNINHKSKFLIFNDIIWCSIKYGAGYTDYYSFGMYDLNKKERKTILTRGKNNSYVAKLNPKEYWHLFDNKNEFNELFKEYLKRDYIYIKDCKEKDFYNFLKNKEYIIVKPNDDSGGHGIEKIKVGEYKSDELLNYLRNKKLYLVEDVVKQHKVLDELYSGSVNTLRIITILNNNKVSFVTAFIRIGNNGFVDNTSSGGMLSMIDLEKGRVLYPACDANLNVYEKHPVTKKTIKGLVIPYFNEAKDLCIKMAFKVPEIKYVAWDIAITDNGPLVIEGNPYPGYYYQFPIHTPNKIGIIPRFEEILNDNKNK